MLGYFKRKKREKKFKEIYSEVVNSFPSIEGWRIRLEYDPSFGDYASLITEEAFWPPRRKPRFNYTICVGSSFYWLNNDEKKAVISHELGHYCKQKNCSAKKVEKEMKWWREIEKHENRLLKTQDLNHRINRLIKWRVLTENYADNKAFEAGYGNNVLGILKNIYQEEYDTMGLINDKILTARIKNLEDKLRQGEES